MENAPMENAPAVYTPLAVSGDSVFSDTSRFELAQRVAKALTTSTMVPRDFQGNVGNCVIALNMAGRMGIDPFMLMQKMYIIHGRPGIEAQLAIALINKSGLFQHPLKFRFEGQGKTRACTAYSTRNDGDLCEQTVTWSMAEKEGWTSKAGSKWQTIPDLMFQYRSAMFFGRVFCPEVLMGMQSADELNDIDMEPISVTPSTEFKPGTVVETLPESESGPIYDVKDAPEPVAETPSSRVEKQETGHRQGEDRPPEGVNLSGEPTTVQCAFEVGTEYDFYSEKTKSTVRVMVAGINKGKTVDDTTLIIQMVGKNGKLTDKSKMVTLAEMNKMAPDKGNDAEHVEPEPAKAIEPSEFQRTKETGTLALMRDAARVAVTPDETLAKLWAKIQKNAWPCNHEKYLAWVKGQASQKQADAAKFTGTGTDRIGDDPDRAALKKIMAKTKELSLDGDAVKLAMKRYKLGEHHPFDLDSRSDIKLRDVQKFLDFLDELTPMQQIIEHINETQRGLDIDSTGADLMARVIQEVRRFSPKHTGDISHLYECFALSGVSAFIAENLDAWCQDPEPESEGGTDFFGDDKQQHRPAPVVMPEYMVNFVDAVRYGADLAGVSKDDPSSPEYTALAAVVSEFLCKEFEMDQMQLSMGLPEGAADRMRHGFKAFFDAKG